MTDTSIPVADARYELSGYHLLRGAGSQRTRAALRMVRAALKPLGIRQTHLPVVAPDAVTAALPDAGNKDVRRMPVRAAGSQRIRGWYAAAGQCAQGLPLLTRRQWSWRELPLGYWSAGPAVLPRERASPYGVEDIVCVNGLVCRPASDPDAADEVLTVLGSVSAQLGAASRRTELPWAFAQPSAALLDPSSAYVVATCHTLRGSESSVRYMGKSGMAWADVTFFYLSQYALLGGSTDVLR
jgi:hypothetical protein